MLAQHGCNFRFFAEIAFSAGVSAPTARVNEIWKRLGASRTFVKVRTFAAKRVRRHDCLRAECRFTYRATEFDLLERRHLATPRLRPPRVICLTRGARGYE